MTRFHTEAATGVITGGSFGLEVVMDVFYGPARTMQDVPLEDWSFSGDYDAKIKTAGTVVIAYQGDFADSISPKEFTDALAPFGQEVRPYLVVTAGEFRERLPLGVYRIDEDPTADDVEVEFNGRVITHGSRVELSLLDRFHGVDVPSMTPEKPADLTSAWAELTRLARLPVTRTVPDVTIPRSITYARNRLEAVQQIAALLGGRACMRSDGTVGVIPDELGEPSIDLRIGDERGTILSVGNSMSSAGVYNAVYGDFEDATGRGFHLEDWIRTGPLAIDGPFGERPIAFPDDQKEFIRSQSQARTALAGFLEQVSTIGPREMPVSVVPDPRIEVGDVTSLERLSNTITGRVVKYTLAKDSAMQLTVRVAG